MNEQDQVDFTEETKRVQAVRNAALNLVVLTEKPQFESIAWWSLFARALQKMRSTMEGQ